MAAAAPAVALWLREADLSGGSWEILPEYTLITVALSIVFLAYFRVGQILPRFLSRRELMKVLKAAAAVTAFSSVAAFFLWRLELVPRSLPVLHFLVLASLLIGWRFAAGAIEGWRGTNALAPRAASRGAMLIIGVNPTTSLYIRLLESTTGSRACIAGILDDNERLHGGSVEGHAILGGAERCEAVLAELASHGVSVERILIAHMDRGAQDLARQRLEVLCGEKGIALDVLADRLGLLSGDDQADPVEAGPGEVEPSQLAALRYLRKRRVADLALAAAALVVLSPVLAAVAVAIRIRLGAPVTFWQRRVGLRGEAIVVHKFRTFSPAVDRLGRLLTEHERASLLGRWLRRLRLDELPQLYDVVLGQMSLIGPRPLLPVDLAPDCTARHSILPGLTGWAQAHGGKAITAEEKNALDEWYVHNASLRIDLRIVWLTLRMLFNGDVREDDAIAQAMAFRRRRLAHNLPVLVAAGAPDDERIQQAAPVGSVRLVRPANPSSGERDLRKAATS